MSAFENRLISLVRQNECLFSTGSRTYKNIIRRQVTWLKISEKIGRPVEECKQRWKSLRDRFVRETRKKEEASATGDDDDQEWEFYSRLEFLREVMKPRKQLGKFEQAALNENEDSFMNFCTEEPPQSPPHKKSRSDSFVDSYAEESLEMPPVKNEDVSLNSEGFIESSDEEIPKGPPTQRPHSKRGSLKSDSFNEPPAEELLQQPPTEKIRRGGDSLSIFLDNLNEILSGRFKATEMDDNEIFMKMLAIKMKQLPPESKIHLQEKFLKDVNREILKKHFE